MSFATTAASRVDAAWTALDAVPDPEVPVLSVVEFGMVRDVQEDEHGTLVVTLTPTYSGCPATEAIAADVRAVACPRCGSADTERLSAFGSTACKALHRCLACREPFEYFKPI